MAAKLPEKASLLAAIQDAANTARLGSKCSVGLLLKKLSDSDRADLEEAFDDPAITTAVIGRVVRQFGHKVGDDSIRRHRRKVCLCGAR